MLDRPAGFGQLKVGEIAGPEPPKIVVLLGCGVDGFPFPARDDERIHLEGGVTDHHREGQGVVHADTEFFEALPDHCLLRPLPRLHMPAHEVPAVGVPPTRRMAMHQEHQAVAHERRDCDRDPVGHCGTLGANGQTKNPLWARVRTQRCRQSASWHDCP